MHAVSSEAEDLPQLTVSEEPGAPGPDALAGLPGDRYRPVARLGAGAFGEVQRAHDRLLDRDVAIKRIRLEAFVEPARLEEVKKRLVREAQVAARLRHRNIVTTHDIVAAPDTSFIVMELVEGETLQSLLARRGRLGLDETVGLLEQVAAALDHAHARGVVHRDVKPANIMIEPSGQVKVMDFGIAKLDEGANLTSTGAVMGTPNYMAPEQARGEKVDARSDLFSLGCVLYECLTGTRPFQSPSVSAILVKILTEDPPPVDPAALGLPGGLKDVLARATAKDPSARYPSGASMIDALRGLGASPTASGPRVTTLATSPSSAPASPTLVSPRVAAGRRLRTLGSIAVAIVVVAALVWIGLALRSPRPLPGHTLVTQEDVGKLGRLLGREPRLLVKLPAGTVLHLSLDAPLSSETAVTGDTFAAQTSRPVRIEGVEAVPEGSRATGRVTHAASAEQAQGRGEMTLALESVALADGESFDVRSKPLGLRAPPAKKKDSSFVVDGLSDLGAAGGGLIGGRRGASAGMVVGGTAGAMVVTTSKGREVALGRGAPLSVELLEPVTVGRPKQP